jgi:DNA-binding response OmpR family regulator
MSSTQPPGELGNLGSYPQAPVDYPAAVPRLLIASDAPWVHDEVSSVLSSSDTDLRHVSWGVDVLPAVVARAPDLVILDLQIGNMGGIATCMELRLEESAGRLPHVPVMILLDRRPDVFLAKRAGAEGWLVKPLDPIRLRKAVYELLVGRTYHDEAFKPEPVAVAEE